MTTSSTSLHKQRRIHHIIAGKLHILLLLLLLIQSACGSSSYTTTPTLINHCQGFTSSQERMFLRDRLMVTAELPPTMTNLTPTYQNEIQQALQQTLQATHIGS